MSKQLTWRQMQHGALIAYVPELPPECEEKCRHGFHPQVGVIPEHDRLTEPRQEWISSRWQVFMQTTNTWNIRILGSRMRLTDALELATRHAAGMEGANLQDDGWNRQGKTINGILENVLEENSKMLQVPEHECAGEFRITVRQDPEHPGPELVMTACETCVYAKSAFAAYMVMEEAHGSAEIQWGQD